MHVCTANMSLLPLEIGAEFGLSTLRKSERHSLRTPLRHRDPLQVSKQIIPNESYRAIDSQCILTHQIDIPARAERHWPGKYK